MLGRLIVALLVVGAAAYSTLAKQDSEEVELDAALSRSRAEATDAKVTELEDKLKAADEKAVAAEARAGVAEAQLESVQAELAALEATQQIIWGSVHSLQGDHDLTRAILRMHEKEVADCYAEMGSNLPGRMGLRFYVNPDGTLREHALLPTDTSVIPVAECILARAQGWTFPVTNRRMNVVQWQLSFRGDVSSPVVP